jgi:hypothetical protein
MDRVGVEPTTSALYEGSSLLSPIQRAELLKRT